MPDLLGFKLYAKDGAVVLQTRYDWLAHRAGTTHTVHLEDGERVIGYKSRTGPDVNGQYDFQLIIGRLE